MRRLTAEIIGTDGGLHPADAAFVRDPNIERVTIDQLNYLTDGTGVMMYHLRGARERITEILEESADVRSYSVLPTTGGHQVYVHFDVEGVAYELLRLTNSYEVVIDFPVQCTEKGIRVTAIGRQEDFVSAMDELPDGVRVELESLTTFNDDSRDDLLLTGRQREILELAVQEGYYDQPRGITRDEIAEQLDVGGSTVSEHLRKAERKVLSDFVE